MEATTMLKSTTLFTNRTVQFHVVAEDQLHVKLKTIFSEWLSVKSGQVLFKLYSLYFPSGENAGEWKRLFKPCAAQRLFLLVSTDNPVLNEPVVKSHPLLSSDWSNLIRW